MRAMPCWRQSRKGIRATLQRLLVMHADVNFTLDGTTPLHLAAEKGYPDIVRTLIGYGADYRIKNALGQDAAGGRPGQKEVRADGRDTP